MQQRLGDRLRLGNGVRSIRRGPDHVELRVGDEVERFDHVVVATHADQALALLEDATPDEQRLLGAFGYTTNEAILHTDSRFLPRASRARASWNYRLGDDGRPTVTYHLNRLQALDTERDYCVTLNEDVPDEHVLERFDYEHPLYTVATLRAQSELPRSLGRPDALRRRVLRERLPRGRPGERRRRRPRARSRLVRSALYTGTLVHARRTPVRHVFRYPVSYWLFDLDELPELERRLRLLSVNRRTSSRCATATTSTASRR